MDLLAAAQTYIRQMVPDDGSLKILLLDAETTQIVSMVFSQSQLLQRQVYLVDRLDNNREKMKHLKCIVFIRPTQESIRNLAQELYAPCYGEYHVYTSNIISKSGLEQIAEADDLELVTKVIELFADQLVVSPSLFSLNITIPRLLEFGSSPTQWNPQALDRATQGILATLLALKKKPVIRYQSNSERARKLASYVQQSVQAERPLFDFRASDTPPILLFLDRKNDPVTPLLLPWTYQAMVHELLNIQNGTVDLSNVPDIRPELKQIVLTEESDPFFKRNVFLNFGDLGSTIKDYVDHFQAKTQSNKQIESIADMKRFVEDYPEFRRLSGNVSKHVTLVSELSRKVESESLLDVSELEQSLACNDAHNQDLKTLQSLIQSSKVTDDAKVRLVALYALRYEGNPNNQIRVLMELLVTLGVPKEKTDVISTLLRVAGASQRLHDPYSSDSIFSRARSGFTGLKGVENVYTQHLPLLEKILSWLIKGKLRMDQYPYADGSTSVPQSTVSTKERPQDIIVFMVGGVTYEEALLIHKISETMPGVRIVLGGTSILRSQLYLDQLREASAQWQTPAGHTARERLSHRVA
ncbi:hypothetical protein CANCADRAFT_87224 [Tortispora caseinolytica NRRL Y-17796]|uniref:Vacuolar protein sorting-associated protein 45 n=1 Tax=Tortispora caseinolytica NRRL Y-17796 TaxID=767744 RepID=A0A1E4TL76_9ASCO|nr:hypothetical protein CANCADRAFT_87224 [Tortispora caseinolytica NRRL Y-17796]